jgi:hypothetical protein
MAMAIAAAVRVILVSLAFGSPSVVLDDTGEKDWSFGQLLTMLLLVLPFISALEIYRGKLLITLDKMDLLMVLQAKCKSHRPQPPHTPTWIRFP